MEYVPKHTTEKFYMVLHTTVLMVKSWWLVIFVMYLWFICDCDGD